MFSWPLLLLPRLLKYVLGTSVLQDELGEGPRTFWTWPTCHGVIGVHVAELDQLVFSFVKENF